MGHRRLAAQPCAALMPNVSRCLVLTGALGPAPKRAATATRAADDVAQPLRLTRGRLRSLQLGNPISIMVYHATWPMCATPSKQAILDSAISHGFVQPPTSAAAAVPPAATVQDAARLLVQHGLAMPALRNAVSWRHASCSCWAPSLECTLGSHGRDASAGRQLRHAAA
ncbi:hypothetical protein CDD83_9874 [Cordyceps sp. RAO-2017]|nr:hypothetical protein CDD83_9874 [Cordyceps sp. RAO-2017]